MAEERKHRTKTRKVNLAFVLVEVFCCLLVMAWYVTNDVKGPEYVPVSACEDCVVYRANGETEQYEDVLFDRLNRGDRAVIRYRLPENVSFPNPELYFPLYNGIVNLRVDDELMFADEYDPEDIAAHYGNRIYELSLPQDCGGHTLTVEITSVQVIPVTDLDEIKICPANESWKNILAGQSLLFVVVLTSTCLAAFFTLHFAVRSVFKRKIMLGLPIALFEFTMLAWLLGSGRMVYLVFGNREICYKMEYYALYLMPVALDAFLCMVLNVPKIRRVAWIGEGVFGIYYIAATVLELSPAQTNYADMLPGLHLVGVIVLVFTVISLFIGVREDEDPYIGILRLGAQISGLCGIADLIRFNLEKYVFHNGMFSFNGISPFAVIAPVALSVSVVTYLILTLAVEYTMEIGQRKLLELAFTDTLTGMPNRAECHRRIEQMEADGITNYSMVFIDMNNLKIANDRYGHDTGDRLLKTAGNVIQQVFSENGFCARWGGDEFVACVFGDRADAERKIDRMMALLKEEDERGNFSFAVSAACGCISSTGEDYLDPLDAIRRADALMYENKTRMKRAVKA